MLEYIYKITDKSKKEKILFDIYYLSGYIIECTLKFVFFSRNNDPNITSCEYLKSHNYTTLKHELAKINIILSKDDFPVFSKKNITGKLIEKWNSEIRYSKKYFKSRIKLNKQKITNYLDEIIKINDKLINKYK